MLSVIVINPSIRIHVVASEKLRICKTSRDMTLMCPLLVWGLQRQRYIRPAHNLWSRQTSPLHSSELSGINGCSQTLLVKRYNSVCKFHPLLRYPKLHNCCGYLLNDSIINISYLSIWEIKFNLTLDFEFVWQILHTISGDKLPPVLQRSLIVFILQLHLHRILCTCVMLSGVKQIPHHCQICRSWRTPPQNWNRMIILDMILRSLNLNHSMAVAMPSQAVSDKYLKFKLKFVGKTMF